MKLLHTRITTLALLLSTLSPPLWAVTADGSFTATAVCDAYLSKNKKTNPDGAKVTVGTTYSVIEANTADDPTWYRLVVDGAAPPERWVDKACGEGKVQVAQQTTGGSSGPTSTPTSPGNGAPTQCTTPGLADGYVFAVSWQSAFCESHRTKPECGSATPESWSANNFTLHGLWPNLTACGTNYGFCSSQPKQKAFCDYPTLPLNETVFQSLGQVMPSAAAGSCLQLHEWYKHGTCQTQWDGNGYFEVAVDLTRQFNDSGIAPFIAQRVGQSVSTQDFLDTVDRSLGEGAHKRLKITCDEGNLVDIYMTLPAAIPAKPNLTDLIRQGKEAFSSNCGESFRVDAVGYAL